MGKRKSKLDETKKLISQLKRKNPRQVDSWFHEAHNKAFSCIDCLECANCCTTTGPLLTDTDIKRASKHLRIKEVDFVSKYVRVDEDGDQIFESMPCPFLGEDNYCSIYEYRPKACKDYPHTNRTKQHQLLNSHVKNESICPAVEQVLQDVQNRLIK